MSTNWKSVDVQCPFYVTDKSYNKIHSISCEGILGKYCSHLFKTRKKKDKFLEEHCIENYSGCEYFQCLMKSKYSE